MANPNSDPIGGGSYTPDPSASAAAGSSAAPAGSAAARAASGSAATYGGEIIEELVAVIAAPNVAQAAPFYRVPMGAHIEVWPDPSNVGNIFSARGPIMVIQGPRAVYAAGTPGRVYPGLYNLQLLWLAAVNANDKFLLRIVKG